MEGVYVAVLLALTVCAHTTIATPRSAQICQQAPDAGPCQFFKTKYYFDADTQTCKTFSYGGCGGNGNKFATQKGCERACTSTSSGGMSQDVCYLPLAVGGCRMQKTRFFYNTTSEACESFVFNGCGGNRNNFPTLDACTSLCQQE